jgi:hypothetical protein
VLIHSPYITSFALEVPTKFVDFFFIVVHTRLLFPFLFLFFGISLASQALHLLSGTASQTQNFRAFQSHTFNMLLQLSTLSLLSISSFVAAAGPPRVGTKFPQVQGTYWNGATYAGRSVALDNIFFN